MHSEKGSNDPPSGAARPLIVVISGLSGSGKTVAMRAAEDCGFHSVENLPPELIDPFVKIVIEKGPRQRIAIGVDVREREFLPAFTSALGQLRGKYDLHIIFLEAEKDVLLRRFKETRRPHPLMAPGLSDIGEAVSMEVELLKPLRENADRIIDTSSFTPHQLRRLIFSLFGHAPEIDVSIISFGYKYGIPQNADLLFDVRFLPNPHFIPALKELDGSAPEVRNFVLEKPQTAEFIKRLVGMLDFLIPLYKGEGKASLTIGVGCTGGRHRSPVIAERVASLMGQKKLNVSVVHRDM